MNGKHPAFVQRRGVVVGIVALDFSRLFHFFHTPFIHLLYTFLALGCMELYEDTFLSEF